MGLGDPEPIRSAVRVFRSGFVLWRPVAWLRRQGKPGQGAQLLLSGGCWGKGRARATWVLCRAAKRGTADPCGHGAQCGPSVSASMTTLPQGLSCLVSIPFLCIFAGRVFPVGGPLWGWNTGLWDCPGALRPWGSVCPAPLSILSPGFGVTSVHTGLCSRSTAPAKAGCWGQLSVGHRL